MGFIEVIDTATNKSYKISYKNDSDCRSVIELKEELWVLLEREEIYRYIEYENVQDSSGGPKYVMTISLSFSGTELRNHLLLHSYSIQSNDILYMTVGRQSINPTINSIENGCMRRELNREYVATSMRIRPSGTMPKGNGLGLF